MEHTTHRPTTADTAAALAHETDRADLDVMSLLAHHVPLALLVDLVSPSGPTSREILMAEGRPAQQWWAQAG